MLPVLPNPAEPEPNKDTRVGLITEIKQITADLRAAREAEYLPITIAGEAVAPSEAARWVRDHREGNDWIPAGVQPGAPLPLDADELADLYHSNGTLAEHEEREIQYELPDLATLPSPPESSTPVTRAPRGGPFRMPSDAPSLRSKQP